MQCFTCFLPILWTLPSQSMLTVACDVQGSVKRPWTSRCVAGCAWPDDTSCVNSDQMCSSIKVNGSGKAQSRKRALLYRFCAVAVGNWQMNLNDLQLQSLYLHAGDCHGWGKVPFLQWGSFPLVLAVFFFIESQLWKHFKEKKHTHISSTWNKDPSGTSANYMNFYQWCLFKVTSFILWIAYSINYIFICAPVVLFI